MDSRGISKDPPNVQAIKDFSEPEAVTGLREFFGMTNQLMTFCPNLTDLTKPLRDLQKRETAWICESDQQRAFCDVKQKLSSDRVLAIYRPNKETVVSAELYSFNGSRQVNIHLLHTLADL